MATTTATRKQADICADHRTPICAECGYCVNDPEHLKHLDGPTTANDENISFRIQDQNRSTFWIESRPKDYRVGVEAVGQGVNYFYFTPEQYKIFIHSEFKRLFK